MLAELRSLALALAFGALMAVFKCDGGAGTPPFGEQPDVGEHPSRAVELG